MPIWEDAEPDRRRRQGLRLHSGDARQFLEALARRLQVDSAFTIAAYEDVFYYLWKERRLPVNVDPLDPKLEDPIERAPRGADFRTGLGQVDRLRASVAPHSHAIGHAALDQPALVSAPRSKCFSSRAIRRMGYRLPLESLPWTKPEDVDCILTIPIRSRSARSCPQKPERKRHLFEAEPCHRRCRAAAEPDQRRKPPEKGESAALGRASGALRQPREGKLFVFMPPVEYLADYLDLVAAIEDTAAYLKMPVLLEGYAPPSDPRIAVLKVTPDPGVIEVNIHPAASWDELVANTTALYDLARQSRLGTEKFMLDGQHTGTGGGNHVVIGGPTAGRQPLPAPSRSAAQPGRLLAQSSVALVSAFGNVHRPHQPASARGRGAHRFHLRTGNRLRPDSGQGRDPTALRGWPIASSATCSPIWPATRIAPSSASTSFIRRMPRPRGLDWWSCAPSRCRRTRA